MSLMLSISLRVAVAVAYTVLYLADAEKARALALPYALLVLATALWDLFDRRPPGPLRTPRTVFGKLARAHHAPERRVNHDPRYDALVRSLVRYGVANAVWLVAIGLLSLYLLDQNGDRSTDIAKQQAGIQEQRAETARRACEDSNRHHDDAIAVALAKFPNGTGNGVAEVIQALSPLTFDCETYVRERVKKP